MSDPQSKELLEIASLGVTDDCRFCEIRDGQERSLFDRSQPLKDGTTYLVPALGMMVPGYFLAVTNDHVTSFAQLEPDQLTAVDQTLTEVEARLSEQLGERYFRVEHGSDQPDNIGSDKDEVMIACGAGGCIDHAHQHLIPADDDVGEHVLDLLPWKELSCYEDIVEFRGAPYIYLGRLGTHYAVANPQLPGQWIRRQVVEERSGVMRRNVTSRVFEDEMGETGDWSLHPGIGNLIATLTHLKAIPLDDSYGDTALMPLGWDNPAFHPSDDYVRPPGTRDWVRWPWWEKRMQETL